LKLVVCYTISDECTYSCDYTQPIEYSSKDEFLSDFEEALNNAIANSKGDFEFANDKWQVYNFTYWSEKTKTLKILHIPEVYELDEWWNTFNQQKS